MKLWCTCGSLRRGSYHVSCLECGRACCPSCLFIFESATYCVACAESIVGVAGLVRPVRETSLDDASSGTAIIRG